MRDIGVIGAGPAGLAAAWRLAAAGRRVRVYEAADRPGGRLRTEEVAGRGADGVVQLLSAGYDRTRALLANLGLADRLVASPGRDALWREGRAHIVRYGSPTSMAASGALPTSLKLRLGLRYLPFVERHADVLDLNDPAGGVAAGLDRESIAEWGRPHLGDAFVEAMAYPLLAAYYGLTPEETSAAFFHALARAGMGVQVMAVRGGMGDLAAAMATALEARGVELRTGVTARALEPLSDGGVRVHFEDAGSTPDPAPRHDAVVLATPPAAATAILGERAAGSLPASVPSRSTATVVVATRSRVDAGWFGLAIPRTEPPGETLAAVCAQGAKDPGATAPGDALVLVPTPPVGERWARTEAGAVAAEALDALDVVLPGTRADALEVRVVRVPDGVWVPAPGHFARILAHRSAGGEASPAGGVASAADPLPDWLALAGDYLVTPTVEGAVRSGLAAADRLLATADPA